MPESYILGSMHQIMLGLEHLHEKQILHADLKPENVFVKETGELKLGDLGLSKVTVTTAGQISAV